VCGLSRVRLQKPATTRFRGGLRGDDFTGLASGIAGAALLVSAVFVLWRTRRRDGSAARRYARRVGTAFAVGVLGILVLYPIGLAYLATHTSRVAVPVASLGVAHHDVRLTTSDGLRLAAWYVPSKNRAAIIVSPGRSPAVQRHAAMLIRHRYGVLVFDRRGEGKSEGDPNLLG
jgi:uncharacterized protein